MRFGLIAVFEATNKVAFIGRQNDRRDSEMVFIVVTVWNFVLPAEIYFDYKNRTILIGSISFYLKTCIPFTFACRRV